MAAAEFQMPDPDRWQTRRRRALQAILAVPALLLVFFAAHGIVTDYREARRSQAALALRTAQAVGRIVEIHSGYSMRTHSTFPVGTITFTAASGKAVRFEAYLDRGDKVGATMPVHYEPDNPQNHALATDAFGFSDVAIGNALPVVFALYMTWLVFRIGRLEAQV